MASATYQTIRIPCQRDQPTVLKDVLAKDKTVTLHRARDIRFELGILRDGEIEDIADFASVTVSVKRLEERDGPALMRKTVVNASFDNDSITTAQWEAGTHEQVVAAFPDADTALPLARAERRKFWLSITAVTTDGETLALAFGEVWMIETGAGHNVEDVTDLTALESASDERETDVTALQLSANPSGTGSPEGVVNGNAGRFYLDTAANVIYVKTTASGTLTGWAPLGGV